MKMFTKPLLMCKIFNEHSNVKWHQYFSDLINSSRDWKVREVCKTRNIYRILKINNTKPMKLIIMAWLFYYTIIIIAYDAATFGRLQYANTSNPKPYISINGILSRHYFSPLEMFCYKSCFSVFRQRQNTQN